ncbi:phage tail tape measure protein [Asticcacaulis taihuensis]|uniref:phage tail tape measure protein n=1 Tax=Asticcacaulis taihuensis TaxID=260084 RepID=UPI0026F24E89|nr:phage tail tape measure protein [Asticcacaulis taihuensis]
MADRKLALLFQFKGVDGLSPMMKGLAGASGGAAANLRRLTAAERDQKAELSRVRDEIEATSGNITHLLDRERALESQLSKTTYKINAQKDALARTEKAQARADALRSKGTTNLATGAAITAPLIIAGKDAADFEDGMVDIEQKADLSAEATEKLKNNILIAAKNAKQLPEAMRLGVDNLAGFGLDPDAAVKMIQPIGRAATAYRATIDDLSKASFAVTDNLKFDDTTKALDIMATAGKRGAFELKDMAQYFPALTASAQGLGQSGAMAVADLSAALQIARRGAGDSQSAANNVQNLLAKINTKDTIKNFKDFGIDLPAAMKKAYAEGKTPMEAIAELTQKATGGDMSKLSFLFGDMQVQQALRPLISNLKDYQAIREEALKASGTVDADFAKRSQTAATNARALMGDLSRLALVAGGALLPAFVQVAGWLNKGADGLSKFAAAHPGVISNLVKVVAVLAMLNLGLGATRLAFSAVVGPVATAMNALNALKGIAVTAGVVEAGAPLIAGALAGIGTAATSFGAAMAAAGSFLLANPIILAIVAVVAVLAIAVPWIIKNWDALSAGFLAFGASLAESFAPIIQGVTAVVNWLGGIWEKIRGPIVAGLRLALNAFLNFTPLGMILKGVMPLFAWLKSLDWSGLGKMMIQGIINGILFMLGPLGQVFKKAAGAGIDAFKEKAKIHSPSRVFMEIGGFITDGLAIGLQQSMSEPMQKARALADGIAGAMTGKSAKENVDRSGISTAIQPSLTATALAGASAGAGPVIMQFGDVHIGVPAVPGQTPESIMDYITGKFEEMKREGQKRARDAFRDDED